MPITPITEFKAAETKAEELYEFLKSLVPYISSSEGCLSCEVLRSNEDKSRFTVIEKWGSVDLHKKSVDNFPRERMQAAIRLFGASPKGGYFHT